MTQEVKLTYFKMTGKYYTEGVYYKIPAQTPSEVIKHLKSLRQEGRLPGVVNGKEFIILAVIDDVPHLIFPEYIEISEEVSIKRDKIEISLEDRKFFILIDRKSGCKETIVINKTGFDSESNQIMIGAKCSNEIELM